MTTPDENTTRKGSRNKGPIGLYSVLSVVILVLIAAVAVTTASSAPPALAEYAPQSIQQIKHAPPSQNGQFGDPGGAPVGVATPPPGASPKPTAKASTPPVDKAPVIVPRTLQCVGDPPRQTFDTQSPPCVASYTGNNGGATSPGVSKDTIRVFVPSWADAEHTYQRVVDDLEHYFNKHFEFYNRNLELSPLPAGGSTEPTATGTCADIQAQADWVAQELKVFAATDNGSDSCWYDELGRKKVLSMSGQQTITKGEQQSLQPYLWSYPMNGDDVLDQTGQFICSQLPNGKAAYSPDAVDKKLDRKYGLLLTTTETQVPTKSAGIAAQLSRCGVKIAKEVTVTTQSSDDQGQSTADSSAFVQAMSNAVLTMKTSGVTTLICQCQLKAAAVASTYANTQNYHPEIVAERSDQNLLASAWIPPEREGMFEVSSFGRQVSSQQAPLVTALQEVDPGFCPCGETLSFLYAQFFYEELLLLSSGIQMAGPNLTPATFAAGLHRTVFPNPYSPLQEGKVGFANNSYNMIMDTTMAWFSNKAPSPQQGDPSGSWCYLEAGRRWDNNAWPTMKLLPDNLGAAPCVT